MRLTNADTRLLHIALKQIGRNIQKIRMHRNFTLKKLSRITRFAVETIDRYELGQRVIEIPTLIKISTALDIELDKLMENP